MVDLLVADLDKETTAAEVEEKNSQEAYEKLMADAREKRAQDAKSVTAKSSTKAEQEEKCCGRERQERGAPSMQSVTGQCSILGYERRDVQVRLSHSRKPRLC